MELVRVTGAPAKAFLWEDWEHTHFDIGFSVNSIPRGKEWLNGKVKRPGT